MRGKHVTKPIEAVVAEARELAADGVRELNLVAQDMTYYGIDLYGKPRLAELLGALEEVEGIDWIRVLYNYPMYFTDELYEALGDLEEGPALPRHAIAAHQRSRPAGDEPPAHPRPDRGDHRPPPRSTIPNLVLRTTFIVGFPGETEAEFEELLAYVEMAKFERLGVFPYSFEPDTPAAKIPGLLPDEVRESRRDRIMAAQQPIAFAFNRGLVGKTLDVLIDGPAPG